MRRLPFMWNVILLTFGALIGFLGLSITEAYWSVEFHDSVWLGIGNLTGGMMGLAARIVEAYVGDGNNVPTLTDRVDTE